MPFGPHLAGERVVLRPPVASDVASRQALGRHAEILRMFGAAAPASGPMTEQEAQSWLASRGGDGTVEWIVEAEGRFLGAARLHHFDDVGSARYAIGLLDPNRFGLGFGTETTRMVVDYAFGPLALVRLEAVVLALNERALRCYRRCGFRPVRRITATAVIDGEPCDDILMEVRSVGRQQRTFADRSAPR